MSLAGKILLIALKTTAARTTQWGKTTDTDPTKAATRTATIAAGKIGDWMEPMTMEYPVKPDAEFQKLHVGDRIEAKLVVEEEKYYVTEVKVVK